MDFNIDTSPAAELARNVAQALRDYVALVHRERQLMDEYSGEVSLDRAKAILNELRGLRDDFERFADYSNKAQDDQIAIGNYLDQRVNEITETLDSLASEFATGPGDIPSPDTAVTYLDGDIEEVERWIELVQDEGRGAEKRVKRRRTERKDSADDLEADVADLKREYDRAVSELADASRAREEAEVALAEAKQKEREAQQAHIDVAQTLREKESELEGARSRGKSKPVTDGAKTLYDIYG